MGLKGSDYVFSGEVPRWLPGPLARVVRDLTYNEVHAMLLGLIGLPLGVAWTTAGVVGRLGVVAVGVLLAVIALVRIPDRTIAAKLVARETWYFSGVFVLSGALGWGVAAVVVA